jgi:hypothetical protein
MHRRPADFAAPRVACIRAVESARRCLKETAGRRDLEACRALCADTASVLEALVEMLERPDEPHRAVALRRMIEAGLATSVECEAECAEHADDARVCGVTAADCERAADALRELLREFVDDDVAERSGAT